MQENANNSVLNILSELVRIPSYGAIEKTHPIINCLKNYYKDCCDIVEIEDANNNTHLLVGVNTDLKDIDNCILLSGHIDTVKESKGHNCNIKIDDDKLVGLGTSDMKSFIATIISNIEYLKKLDIPVVFSITSDEETKLLGITQIIKELKKRNINPSLTIIGEPTDLDYYMSSRGNSIYVSVMNGKSCHSGTPELGINAIELIAKFILEIEKISKEFKDEAAICITSIKGGKTPSNVVPDECSICFGIRTLNSKTLDAIYNYLMVKHNEISRCYGNSSLFNVLTIPPFERRENEFFIRQSKSNNKKLIDAKYATEAGYFQREYPDSDIVIYGPGNPDCIHKAGEAIDTNNLLKYNNELIEIIESYLKYQKENNKSKVKKLIYKSE